MEVRLRRRLEIRAHRSVVVPPVHRAGLLCAVDLPQQLRVQALPPEPVAPRHALPPVVDALTHATPASASAAQAFPVALPALVHTFLPEVAASVHASLPSRPISLHASLARAAALLPLGLAAMDGGQQLRRPKDDFFLA